MTENRKENSYWSPRLGRLLGIDIHLHVTFLLLLAFIGVAHWLPQRSLLAALTGVLFFGLLFLCVLLHELGHALAARRTGRWTAPPPRLGAAARCAGMQAV